MTNQKELSVRQIRTMLNKTLLEAGEPHTRTTKEIELLLKDEKAKEQIYISYALGLEIRKLRRQIKRKQLKNSTNTVQIQH